jgi:FkbM family methyltransferase
MRVDPVDNLVQLDLEPQKSIGASNAGREYLPCRDLEMEASNGSGVLVDHPIVAARHGQMSYFASDDPIGKSLGTYREWAELEIGLLCSFIGLGSVVIDVGANIGTHSLAFSRHVGPRGSVRAFEPQAAVFDVLQRNLVANGCVNTKPIRAGVGRTAGEMFVPKLDYYGHVNIGALALSHDRTDERTPIIALDDLDLPACDLVKIDAEGMEEDVLAGMAGAIHRLRPVIYLECNSVDTGAAILSAVKWAQYQCFLVRTAAHNDSNYAGTSSNLFGVAHECGVLCIPEAISDLVPTSRPGVELLPIVNLHTLADALLKTPRYGDSTLYDRDPIRMREALGKSFDKQICELTVRIEAAELRARDAEAQALMYQSNCAGVETQVRDLTTQLEMAESRTLSAETQVSLYDSNCKSLDVQVCDLTAQLEAIAREARDHASASRADLVRLEFRAASLVRQLECAEDKLKRLEPEAAAFVAAQATIAGLNRDIEAIRASTSWRITVPLRRILGEP